MLLRQTLLTIGLDPFFILFEKCTSLGGKRLDLYTTCLQKRVLDDQVYSINLTLLQIYAQKCPAIKQSFHGRFEKIVLQKMITRKTKPLWKTCKQYFSNEHRRGRGVLGYC